jgi:hypothetical protein
VHLVTLTPTENALSECLDALPLADPVVKADNEARCRPEDPHLRRRFSVTCRTTNKLTRRFDIFGIPPQSISTNSGQKLVEDPRDCEVDGTGEECRRNILEAKKDLGDVLSIDKSRSNGCVVFFNSFSVLLSIGFCFFA